MFLPVATVKPSRREKSAATRAKILTAAHEEFCERGFHGATVTSIAKRAGVAPQTIYFVFRTKAVLISAVIDRQVMGEEPTPPQETVWWREMHQATDAAGALRAFVAGVVPVFARAAMISEVLTAAALTDDELRATYDGHERLRREGYAEVVDVLAAKGSLRPGLGREQAVDVLLTVLGDRAYVDLTRDHGWSDDQLLAWLQDALPRLLLAD